MQESDRERVPWCLDRVAAAQVPSLAVKINSLSRGDPCPCCGATTHARLQPTRTERLRGWQQGFDQCSLESGKREPLECHRCGCQVEDEEPAGGTRESFRLTCAA